jgi:hypothetical protein
VSRFGLLGHRLGKCNDCGHPCTVYAWKGSLPLSRAVCPVHRSPLARTTPKDTGRIVVLEMAPTKTGGGLARRLTDKAWRPLREVLA